VGAADGGPKRQDPVPELLGSSGARESRSTSEPDHSQALAHIFRNYNAEKPATSATIGPLAAWSDARAIANHAVVPFAW